MHACANCGAPLPIAAPGVVERCPFCEAETREPLDPQPRPSTDVPPAERPRESPSAAAKDPTLRLLNVIFIVIAVAGAGAGVVVALHACSQTDSHGSVPVTPPPTPAPAPVPTLTLANLTTMPFAGSETLDAPGMVGTYESFDAAANCDWARKIGTTWKPDAVMYLVEAQHIAKDGTVNLTTTGAGVVYAFGSAKCAAEFHSTSALDHQKCALFVEVKASPAPHVTVRREGLQASLLDRAHAVSNPVCTFRQAVAALGKAMKLPARSFYDAELSSATHELWSVSMLASDGSGGGRVNAATCAVE